MKNLDNHVNSNFIFLIIKRTCRTKFCTNIDPLPRRETGQQKAKGKKKCKQKKKKKNFFMNFHQSYKFYCTTTNTSIKKKHSKW